MRVRGDWNQERRRRSVRRVSLETARDSSLQRASSSHSENVSPPFCELSDYAIRQVARLKTHVPLPAALERILSRRSVGARAGGAPRRTFLVTWISQHIVLL